MSGAGAKRGAGRADSPWMIDPNAKNPIVPPAPEGSGPVAPPAAAPPEPVPDSVTRVEARIDAGNLSCHAGRVLDLSGSGMRLLVAWKNAPRVGEPEEYRFGEGADEVRVMGTVRWVRPAGRLYKRAEVGVEFVGLTPKRRDALRKMAITGDMSVLRDADQDKVRVGYPDLYRMLGVSPYASQEDIRRAYHQLSKQVHPDHSADPEAGAKFAELNKAYSILRDKEMRARYDERLAREQQRAA